MNITSFSLSYLFLGACLISLVFFLYFKTLIVKTEPNNKSREKIVGTMKDPDSWRAKNNMMSYISAFWTVLSLILFIYFKFYYKSGLINVIYFFAYIAVIVLSVVFLGARKKSKSKS
ncbi:hypothetical protein [Clostridium ganghwense]|uniref:SdpI family protein n=1 Tax=Clostridium ganghwense TaxID=312089 RepID=A0ABT4CPI2_9CLOT|nr:hypothetical protein [Clostridium ganghwense]MCY6370863.1 hypothetical protein [Clostridium ganghwense]